MFKKVFKKKLLWQLFPSYLFVIAVSVILITIYTVRVYKDFYINNVQEKHLTIIKLYENNFISGLTADSLSDLENIVNEINQISEIRITLIAKNGKVIIDSDKKAEEMKNHLDRPEIIKAMSGKISTQSRFSSSIGKNMLYVAFPLVDNDQIVGVIRSSVPITTLEEKLNNFYREIFLLGLITTLIAGFISLSISRRLRKPIEVVEKSALEFAEGNFSKQIPDPSIEEIKGLVRAMNTMATRLKRLETLRKDFIANVSHELKTPVTTIKGFIETLKDGAINNPEEANRFLSIISKHTSRLDLIIEDLLSLSRLEQPGNKVEDNFEKLNLSELLENVAHLCESSASAKNLKIQLNCNENLFIKGDSSLFEQAILNLLDNAVKYSDNGKSINISAYDNKTNIVIEIEDQGYGIAKEHLDRIFERFYRVDKARSRKVGGTGLGLSIAKHIINVHNGSINVVSEIEKGSTFSISLPIVE